MSDQRRFARIAFDITARLEGPYGEQAVRVADISLKGVLLLLQDPIPATPASGYRLSIVLSESATIVMNLKLAHLDGPGAGFVCERIDLDSLSHLRRLFELNLADAELLQRELSELGA